MKPNEKTALMNALVAEKKEAEEKYAEALKKRNEYERESRMWQKKARSVNEKIVELATK